MGRGQQMNNWDMEGSVVDTFGKDFRSLKKRRAVLFVTFLALLLPFLITSSYIHYNSTEVLMFFQRRPSSTFLSPKDDTDTSLFDNDTGGSDIQVEPKIEYTENTAGSLGTNPTESGNLETDAMVIEDVAAEAPSAVLAENEEEKVDSSETVIHVNETSFPLEFSEQERENLTTAEVEDSSSHDVNATMIGSGDSKLNASDDSSNIHQPEIADAENTGDSLGAKPVKGNTDAMAEKEEGEREKSNSPDVNENSGESDGWKQSKVSNEEPNNHQQSEPNVISMESHNKGVCDLAKGSWVPDSRPPQYTNATCPFIQKHQDCIRNGRPDTGYLHWKWQPEHCELPRIDAKAFLNAMRNKSMYIVGDSLARNQFQSLLCLLSQAEIPDHTFQRADDRDNVYVFRSHNFTFAIYWSTHLVHVEDKLITWPDNSTLEVAHIHLDKLDREWAERVPGIDILQISTGQWWFKRALFYLGGQPIGCHWWEGDDGHIFDEWKECTKTIGFGDPYRMAIHNALQGSLSIPGYTGTTIFRTFAPDHFEDGQWHNGGKCVRTSPGGVPMTDLTKAMYDIQIQEFQNVTGALSASEKKRIKMLDITNLAQVRADGHPDAYRNFQPFSKESKQPVQKDCLHWCIPGPIDTWNDLLVETLHQ
ncbi:hypothetical protein KC19_12G043400 [Ceratodon purpureus]|uniref:Trichome birefringence-like N-terminal domain-containing protein n=1 Tax=Ceratodon purpureus TaxID=3225 RepID=A0A8T0G5X7_CERPU|nr:hypothetical protein KC19_12G043400 [Ceratodon purpureus]